MEGSYTTWEINQVIQQQFLDTVNALVKKLIKPECLKRDLLFASLLILMKENDFVLLKEYEEKDTILNNLLTNRHVNKNEAKLILKGFPGITAKVIACPLADTILINATVPLMYKHTYSLCIKVSRYILTSNLGIPATFANLEELFMMLKEKIIAPIKGIVLNYYEYPSGNLSGLPDDILLQMLLTLPIRDVLNLSESCKRIYRLVKEDRLWSKLYKRDFPDKSSEGVEWRENYKDVYVLKQVAKNNVGSTLVDSENFDEVTDLSNHFRRVYDTDSRWEVIL